MARSNGLEIVLLVLGAVLLVRFVTWTRDEITRGIDAAKDEDALVRSEASKHRHALAQILSWVLTVLVWTIMTALVLNRLGVPFASIVAPLAAGGLVLGLGAQRVVQDLLAGGFIIAERQYGFGDLRADFRHEHDRRCNRYRRGPDAARHASSNCRR